MSKGIQFIVDESGEKTSVVIDLNEHGELWEDMYDALLARERADEPRHSLDEVRKTLIEEGKIDGDDG